MTPGVFEQESVIVWTDATFSVIFNDLEYFDSGTLPKKVNFRTDFFTFFAK